MLMIEIKYSNPTDVLNFIKDNEGNNLAIHE